MTNCTTTINFPLPERPSTLVVQGLRMVRKGLSLWAISFFDAVLARLDADRSLHHLRGLDDRMLKDIGLNRCDVERARAKAWY